MYHPRMMGELLEYRDHIESVAGTHDWERVYAYDKRFRRVQAENPLRHWGLINTEARDKSLNGRTHSSTSTIPKATSSRFTIKNPEAKTKGKKSRRELCRRWNLKQECKYGDTCYYEHVCAMCGKQGHGACNCPKLKHSSAVKLKKENK